MVTRTSHSKRPQDPETPSKPARITGKAPKPTASAKSAAAAKAAPKAKAKAHTTTDRQTADRVEPKKRKTTTRVTPADEATRAYGATGTAKPKQPEGPRVHLNRDEELLGAAAAGLLGAGLLGVFAAFGSSPRAEAHVERAIDDVAAALFGGLFG